MENKLENKWRMAFARETKAAKRLIEALGGNGRERQPDAVLLRLADSLVRAHQQRLAIEEGRNA